MASIVLKTSIVQIINIAPTTTLDQIRTLFGHIGPIDKLVLYPEEDKGESVSKVGYIRFKDTDSAGVALHLNNTVFLDRALIVLPLADDLDQIPQESFANLIRAPVYTTAGVPPRNAEWPVDVISLVVGKPGEQVIMTIDPRLSTMGLPPYPPLPATTDSSKIEEVRRTVLVTNLDQGTTAEQVLEFFGVHAEVRFVRVADSEKERAAYVEFTHQKDVAKAFQLMGATLNNKQIMVQHSTTPITKLSTLIGNGFDEAAKRVKEAESLISGSVEKMYSRSRSRSRRRSHHRSSRSRRRSRSRDNTRSSKLRRKSRSRDGRSSRSRRRTRSRESGSSRLKRISPSRSEKKRRSKSRDKKESHTRRKSHSRDRHKSRSRSIRRDKIKSDSKRKDKERSSDTVKEKSILKENEKSQSNEIKKENSVISDKADDKDGFKEKLSDDNKKSKEDSRNSLNDSKTKSLNLDNDKKTEILNSEVDKQRSSHTSQTNDREKKGIVNESEKSDRGSKRSNKDRESNRDHDKKVDRDHEKNRSEKDRSRSLREDVRKRSRSRDKTEKKRSRDNSRGRKRSHDKGKDRHKSRERSKDTERSRDRRKVLKEESREPRSTKERRKVDEREQRKSHERTKEKSDQPKDREIKEKSDQPKDRDIKEKSSSKPLESRKRSHEPSSLAVDPENDISCKPSLEDQLDEPEIKRLPTQSLDSSQLLPSLDGADPEPLEENVDNTSDMEMDIDDDSNDSANVNTSLSNGINTNSDSFKLHPEYDEYDPPPVNQSTLV